MPLWDIIRPSLHMQLHISVENGPDNLILESNQKGSNSSFAFLEKKDSIYKNINWGQFSKKFKEISKKISQTGSYIVLWHSHMHNYVQRSFTSTVCPGTHASLFNKSSYYAIIIKIPPNFFFTHFCAYTSSSSGTKGRFATFEIFSKKKRNV